jgi:hypothetical protein
MRQYAQARSYQVGREQHYHVDPDKANLSCRAQQAWRRGEATVDSVPSSCWVTRPGLFPQVNNPLTSVPLIRMHW